MAEMTCHRNPTTDVTEPTPRFHAAAIQAATPAIWLFDQVGHRRPPASQQRLRGVARFDDPSIAQHQDQVRRARMVDRRWAITTVVRFRHQRIEGLRAPPASLMVSRWWEVASSRNQQRARPSEKARADGDALALAARTGLRAAFADPGLPTPSGSPSTNPGQPPPRTSARETCFLGLPSGSKPDGRLPPAVSLNR